VHLVPHGDLAALGHEAVERELAAETAVDVTGDLLVPDQRVRGFRIPRRETFATLRVGPTAPSRAVIPEVLRDIEPIVTGPVKPTREVRLGWKLSLEHGVDFTINKDSHHRAEPCRVGELQVWDIVNASPVHHPFHLHGFFFQVLEVNGKVPEFLSWEDTVNIPARGRVRIAWVPDDRPGSWMYHCHILEHHAAGMMAHFDVVR
jgi:FtsP/CotA-like multicopper oxidase with cupredoxin domain